MSDERAGFDPEQLATAERLDAKLSSVLAGAPPPGTDPVALWLATAMRPRVPGSLERVVARAVLAPALRAWRWVRLSAAGLALVLAAQGLSGIVSGEWVAERLDEPFSAHAFAEGGFALIAAALAVAAGSLRRSWAPVAVVVGAPLGIALGAGGIGELGDFAAGAALHLTQGALAICLLATWWRARRYETGPDREPST